MGKFTAISTERFSTKLCWDTLNTRVEHHDRHLKTTWKEFAGYSSDRN